MFKWLIAAVLALASSFASAAPAAPFQFKADAIPQLRALAADDNFAADQMLYTGVRDPVLRAKLNHQLGAAILKFVKAVEQKASKEALLRMMAAEIAAFKREALDSEDAEQVALNFEKIMDCIGLESSDGILNQWMYGFDPNRH